MSDLSMLPSIIVELQKRFGMVYEETVYLEDEDGERHLFFVATVRGARVFFDEVGQIWMTEAEIIRVTDMKKQAVGNAIQRLKESNLGEAICQVHNLWTTDRRGHKRLRAFYDEETVAAIITRGRDQSPKALEFLAERKAIIHAVRLLAHRYALATYEENQQLVDKLNQLSEDFDKLSYTFEEERQLRVRAERRIEDAEQDANDARRELWENVYRDLLDTSEDD